MSTPWTARASLACTGPPSTTDCSLWSAFRGCHAQHTRTHIHAHTAQRLEPRGTEHTQGTRKHISSHRPSSSPPSQLSHPERRQRRCGWRRAAGDAAALVCPVRCAVPPFGKGVSASPCSTTSASSYPLTSPFHISQGHMDVCIKLIRAGADPTFTDIQGRCSRPCLPRVAGPAVVLTPPPHLSPAAFTVVHLAAQFGFLELMVYFLARGVVRAQCRRSRCSQCISQPHNKNRRLPHRPPPPPPKGDGRPRPGRANCTHVGVLLWPRPLRAHPHCDGRLCQPHRGKDGQDGCVCSSCLLAGSFERGTESAHVSVTPLPCPALYFAVESRKVPVVSVLVEYHASLDIADSEGKTVRDIVYEDNEETGGWKRYSQRMRELVRQTEGGGGEWLQRFCRIFNSPPLPLLGADSHGGEGGAQRAPALLAH